PAPKARAPQPAQTSPRSERPAPCAGSLAPLAPVAFPRGTSDTPSGGGSLADGPTRSGSRCSPIMGTSVRSVSITIGQAADDPQGQPGRPQPRHPLAGPGRVRHRGSRADTGA